MAYEKFIKKDGKTYGPYIYHSKRIDGKVVSEYHGQRKIDYKKFFLIAFGVFLAVTLVYFLAFSEKSITGKTVLDLNANYQKDKPLSGQIKMSLQEGELIPATSKLIVENNGQSFEYSLKDLVSEQTTNGNFYVNGISAGSGEGYGAPGVREISPAVYFTLSILTEKQETETQTGTTESTEIQAEATTAETETKTQTEKVVEPQIETTTTEQETQEAPITGNAIVRVFSGVSNFFLGLTPTGLAIVESEDEVQGQVSSGQEFKYTLQEGQRVELKPRSVKTDTKQLSDDEIDLEIKGNEIIVTTTYTEKESGFGNEYLGQKEKEIVIDLSKLDLILAEGDLKASIVDQGQELLSVKTTIEEGEVVAEQIQTQNNSNSTKVLEIEENETFVPLETSELTLEERTILENEFGNFSLEAKESVLKNGFIVIRYELGKYWVEYSYDADLSNETLASFMEADKIKWLKDVAKTIA